MHHSKVCHIVIDALPDAADDTVAFWSGMLGLKPRSGFRKNSRYVELEGELNNVRVLIQRVEKNPGLHLDIETDDKRAELARAEALGAKRKQHIKRWWVMQDPAGHGFCIVRPQHEDFPRAANYWLLTDEQ